MAGPAQSKGLDERTGEVRPAGARGTPPAMRRHDPPKIRKTLPPTRLTESGDQPTLKQPNQRISVPPLAPPPQMLADGDPTQTDLGRLRAHVERIDAASQGKIPLVRFPPPPAVPTHRIGGVLPKPNAPPRAAAPVASGPLHDDFDQDVTADARIDAFSTESYRAQALGTVGELDTAEVSTVEEAIPTHAPAAAAAVAAVAAANADDSEDWNDTVTAPKGVPTAPKSAPHAHAEPAASAKSSSGVRLAHETSSNYHVLASDEVEYSDFADDDDEDDETRAMNRDELMEPKEPDLRNRLSASGDHFVSSSEITAASLDVQTLARSSAGPSVGQPAPRGSNGEKPTMPDGDPETLQAVAMDPRKHPATLVSRETKPPSERPPPRRAAVAAALADSGAVPLSPSTSPMPVMQVPVRALAQEPALLDLSDAHPVPGETTSVAPLQAPAPRYAPANVHPAPMYATLASPQPLYAPAPTYPPPTRPRTEQMNQPGYGGYPTPGSQPPAGYAPSFSTPAPHVVPAAPAVGSGRQATFPPGQFPAAPAPPARPRYLLWVAYGLLVGGFGVIFGARYFGAADAPAATSVASAPVASSASPTVSAAPQPPPQMVAPPPMVASVAPSATASAQPSVSASTRPVPAAEAQNQPKPRGGGYHPPAPRPQPAAARPPKPEGPSLPQSMDPPQPPQPATPSPSDILTDAL